MGLPDGRLFAEPAQLQQGRAREEIIDDDQGGRAPWIRRLHGVVVGFTQRLARKRSIRPIVKLPQCSSQGFRVVALGIESLSEIPGPVVVALQYWKGKRRTSGESASLLQQLELLVIVADPRLGNRPSEKGLDPPRQCKALPEHVEAPVQVSPLETIQPKQLHTIGVAVDFGFVLLHEPAQVFARP